MTNATNNILRSKKGFEFKVNNKIWQIPPLELNINEKICFIPKDDETNSDSSVELCKIVSSLEEIIAGDFYLFDNNISKLNYSERLELRKQIGYIQSNGGLFSTKTVAENISYPLTFHSGHNEMSHKSKLDFFLEKFNLVEYQNLKPHEIDGLTRWRTCAARGLITGPNILIVEGIGDWNYKKKISFFWQYILEKDLTLVVGLTSMDYSFQEWFKNKLQGKLIDIDLARVII